MCTFVAKYNKKYMKNITLALLSLLCVASFVCCNNYETYGEKKDKERNAINSFISDSAIVVISESKFHAQGDVTDLGRNEFVYLDNSGVYMQIVRRGCGKPLQDGETTTLLVRFAEISIMQGTGIYNDTSPYTPDYMNISRSGNSFSATFTQGIWLTSYGSSYSTTAAVPQGLLVPFMYVNVGRPKTADDEIAKVRLIVPHSQGHTIAASYVYPYYYELTFERQIDL